MTGTQGAGHGVPLSRLQGKEQPPCPEETISGNRRQKCQPQIAVWQHPPPIVPLVHKPLGAKNGCLCSQKPHRVTVLWRVEWVILPVLSIKGCKDFSFAQESYDAKAINTLATVPLCPCQLCPLPTLPYVTGSLGQEPSFVVIGLFYFLLFCWLCVCMCLFGGECWGWHCSVGKLNLFLLKVPSTSDSCKSVSLKRGMYVYAHI